MIAKLLPLKLLCPAVLMALCLFAQPAWSITIDASDIVDGASHVRNDADGFDIWANGGNFIISDFSGVDGFFGIEGGHVDKEIDVSGEDIVITFDMPQIIDVLEIGRLFELSPTERRWDQVNEVAMVIAEDRFGAETIAFLTVIDELNASWTGACCVVTNLSPGDATGAGLWEILNPFDDLEIVSLTFLPEPAAPGTVDEGKYDSDFALRKIETTEVPEPVTAGMLGFGLLGLGILGRRQRR
jgi:hypothetical protein